MVSVVEVKTKKQMKQFVKFPLRLYKDDPYYVPAFYRDEYNLFFPNKSVFAKTSKVKFFLAMRDDKVVGRIAGIIVPAYIEKTNRKIMRFSRIDLVDDDEVGDALLKAVEDYAREEGMDGVHGPMGFADTDREGLLIYGFDKLSTYAENYSYEYYIRHIERNGYVKEVDWLEYKIEIPQQLTERFEKLAGLVARRYNLEEKATKDKSIPKIINDYGEKIFNLINVAYEPLHGTVPLEGDLKEDIIKQFKIFLSQEFISIVTDKDENVVGFGVVLPSLAKELRRSRGYLTLASALRILKIKNNPEYVEFAIIAVAPEYHRRGVNAMIMNKIHKGLISKNITFAETNLELETNTAVISQWDGFEKELIKKRRCYIKDLV